MAVQAAVGSPDPYITLPLRFYVELRPTRVPVDAFVDAEPVVGRVGLELLPGEGFIGLTGGLQFGLVGEIVVVFIVHLFKL